MSGPNYPIGASIGTGGGPEGARGTLLLGQTPSGIAVAATVASDGRFYVNSVQGYSTPVSGGQMGLNVTTATALTVPATARAALVSVEGNSVRWRDDGTNPTASVGQLIPVGSIVTFLGDSMSAVKFIQVSATATLNVSYYK